MEKDNINLLQVRIYYIDYAIYFTSNVCWHRIGAVYTGNFVNGMFHGEGRYQYLDGANYFGLWHNNKMHGKGEYVDSDGTSWNGTFFNGMYDSGRTYITVRPSQGL